MNYFESEEFQELCKAEEESRKIYESQCNDYWDSLSYDDKIRAFYSVVKRIHQGELKDNGTYRWILYDVFGFGPEAYSIGMECGFMDLHNRILADEEYDRYVKSLRNKDGSIQI